MSARDEIAGMPSDDVRATLQAMRAEVVLDAVDLLASYTELTRQAVWRGDNLEAATCLWRARRTMIEVLAGFRALAPNEAAAVFHHNSETGEPLSTPGSGSLQMDDQRRNSLDGKARPVKPKSRPGAGRQTRASKNEG